MLSFEEDEYIVSLYEHSTRWVVKLNNGQNVYQDDGRDGILPESAWTRLKQYCKENHLWIIDMRLQFRSHVEHLPSNKSGYFFCKSILGSPALPKNIHFYVSGYVENSVICTTTWRIPELVENETETRNIQENQECLIQKPPNF